MDQTEKSWNVSKSKSHYDPHISILSLFPLLLTIFLLCSSSSILNLIRANSTVDVEIGLGQWLLFYSLALTAPCASFLSHTMSAGWLILSGSFVTISGVMTVPFCPKSNQQIMLFSVSTGIGTALVFHGSFIVLSQRYARQSVFSCILMLLTFIAVITHAEPLLNKINTMLELGMLIGVVCIFTCVLPASMMIRESRKTNQAMGELSDDTRVPVTQSQTTRLYLYQCIYCHQLDSHTILSYIGWILSFAWWTIGINLTWTNSSDAIIIIRTGNIQCILLLLCFWMQYFTDKCSGACETRTGGLTPNTPINNHFLLLGLIGAANFTIVNWPDYTSCDNYLLFTLAYVVQVIDFNRPLSVSAIPCTLPQKASSANGSGKPVVPGDKSAVSQTTTFSCKALMIFFFATVIFYLLLNPVAHSITSMIISVKGHLVDEVVYLIVLILVAVTISVIQPGGKTAT